jgi:hypothetical protein
MIQIILILGGIREKVEQIAALNEWDWKCFRVLLFNQIIGKSGKDCYLPRAQIGTDCGC